MKTQDRVVLKTFLRSLEITSGRKHNWLKRSIQGLVVCAATVPNVYALTTQYDAVNSAVLQIQSTPGVQEQSIDLGSIRISMNGSSNFIPYLYIPYDPCKDPNIPLEEKVRRYLCTTCGGFFRELEQLSSCPKFIQQPPWGFPLQIR